MIRDNDEFAEVAQMLLSNKDGISRSKEEDELSEDFLKRPLKRE